MATENDPTKPIADKISQFHDWLNDLLKSVLKKLETLLKPLRDFIKELAGAAKDIANKVGQSVVDKLLGAADNLFEITDALRRDILAALKVAKQMMDLIYKAVNPTAIYDKLKTLMSKFVKMFRLLAEKIIKLLSHIGIIDMMLKVLKTFALLLQAIFKWFGKVTGVVAAVQRAQKILKQVVKQIKVELKNVIALGKETAGLKAA